MTTPRMIPAPPGLKDGQIVFMPTGDFRSPQPGEWFCKYTQKDHRAYSQWPHGCSVTTLRSYAIVTRCVWNESKGDWEEAK